MRPARRNALQLRPPSCTTNMPRRVPASPRAPGPAAATGEFGCGCTIRIERDSRPAKGTRPAHEGVEAGDSEPRRRASRLPRCRSGRSRSSSGQARAVEVRSHDACDHPQRVGRDGIDEGVGLATRPGRPDGCERGSPEVAREQSPDSRAREPEAGAVLRVARQDERVGQDMPHACRLDVAPIRCGALSPKRVPVGKQHSRGGVLHSDPGRSPGALRLPMRVATRSIAGRCAACCRGGRRVQADAKSDRANVRSTLIPRLRRGRPSRAERVIASAACGLRTRAYLVRACHRIDRARRANAP